MTKPRIIAIVMLLVFLSCKDSQSHSERPFPQQKPDPSIAAPEKSGIDSLRTRPAKRKLRKKETEDRKKSLDTLKPTTT